MTEDMKSVVDRYFSNHPDAMGHRERGFISLLGLEPHFVEESEFNPAFVDDEAQAVLRYLTEWSPDKAVVFHQDVLRYCTAIARTKSGSSEGIRRYYAIAEYARRMDEPDASYIDRMRWFLRQPVYKNRRFFRERLALLKAGMELAKSRAPAFGPASNRRLRHAFKAWKDAGVEKLGITLPHFVEQRELIERALPEWRELIAQGGRLTLAQFLNDLRALEKDD